MREFCFITGKGNHSKRAYSVVKASVVNYLNEQYSKYEITDCDGSILVSKKCHTNEKLGV